MFKCRASPVVNICADEKKKGLNSFLCNAWLSPRPFPLHLNAYNLQGGQKNEKLFLHRQIQSPPPTNLNPLDTWQGFNKEPWGLQFPHAENLALLWPCHELWSAHYRTIFFPFHPSQKQGLKFKSSWKRDLIIPDIQTAIKPCSEPDWQNKRSKASVGV